MDPQPALDIHSVVKVKERKEEKRTIINSNEDTLKPKKNRKINESTQKSIDFSWED